MSEKKSRKALSFGKCPACGQGDIFKYPYSNLAHFADMNKACPACGTSFEPEPGFYFGAMYITYAFNIVILVAFGVSIYAFLELPEMVYLVMIAIVAVVTTPFSFRISRILWLNWFGGLKPRPDSNS